MGGRNFRLWVGILPLVVGSWALAQEVRPPARVQVNVDTSGPSTRVILTLSRPVSSAIAVSGGDLRIVYVEPVLVEPATGEIDDALLASWAQQGDRTLAIRLGPAYERYESFELRNPTRLVLDLLGGRPEVPPLSASGERDRTIVVIDPGHGGIENGAVGPDGLREKDVTLDLASRLKKVLQRLPGVSVVLTRDDDRQLSLDERTAIANHNRAHLFLSIHVNSSRRKDARGAETYYLSAKATDNEARTLAALENQAYDADHPLGPPPEGKEGEALELILWDLAQNQYLAESSRLAEGVQHELNELAGTRDRGVRQAPFRVLMGATMPAILVEVGFISNRDEEELLRSSAYRDRLVEAIARAVEEFLRGRAQLTGPATTGSGASQP